jgi:GNAT superfamily N-acetyltransferase
MNRRQKPEQAEYGIGEDRSGSRTTPAIRRSTRIRAALAADLDAINRVVEKAVMSWDLPERVKRLALPSYRYTESDLNHFEVVVAEVEAEEIIGVAAWEQADPTDIPAGCTGVMLHGIFVDPGYHRRGIGGRLFGVTENAVRRLEADGLLVRAQKDANGFFISRGMIKLAVEDPLRQYDNRFWKLAGDRR